MKKFLIALVAIILPGCQTRINNPTDVSAIHKWIFNYEQAISTSNIEAVLSGESESIVYYPPNQPSFSGKENLRNWLLTYFNYYNPSEVLLSRNIQVRGDLAYVSCNYIISAKVKYSGEEFKDTGKMINVFKRERFGLWRRISCIWNSNNRTLDLHSQIPADFSGIWELNLSRSTPAADVISSTIVISQKGNNVNIDRSYELKDKEPAKSNLNCTIGRKIKSNSETGSLTTSSYWSDDRKSFTIIESILSKTGKEYTRTTVYSLSPDAEMLYINSYDQLPNGSLIASKERQIEMTYDKILKKQ